MSSELTVEELLEFLYELDDSDANVTEWEADFIESVLYAREQTTLSAAQIKSVESMVEKYGRSIGYYV